MRKRLNKITKQENEFLENMSLKPDDSIQVELPVSLPPKNIAECLNTVLIGDFRAVLADLPSKTFNLCITDIPFNVGWQYGVYKDNLTDKEYYDNCISWFTEIKRLSERAIIKIPTKFSYVVLPAFAETLGYYWTLIQHSPNTTSHGRFNLHLYTQYLVSEGSGKKPGVDLFVNTNNSLETEHPAEMPVKPIKKILSMFCEEEALVLDPFLGSGTTAVACIQTNRKFVGVEINPEFAKIAKERISKHSQQTNLFFEVAS